jgi:putative ABC transport system permease protein
VRAEQIFAMAWENLKQRKLRTSLTTLGVIIGITAIIALASLGEGFRITVKERMEQGFELDVLTVIPGNFLLGLRQPFTNNELGNISKIENVVTAAPVYQIGNVTLYNNQTGGKSNALVAAGVNFTQFWQLFPDRLVFENGSLPDKPKNDTMIIGYKPNHQDDSEIPFAQPSANITMTVAKIGRKPENFTFTVAGTLQKRGTAGLGNFDYWVLIPLEKAREIYQVKEGAQLIFVQIADLDASGQVADDIEALFPPFQISVLVPTTFIRQVDQILNLIQIFLTAIASISLVVAGIGIMNIMTVSVMERTREIGIMKAIGARNTTILIMFLSEAALVGLLGGLIGVPTAYGLSTFLSFVLTHYMQQQTTGESFFDGSQNGEAGFSPVFSFEWTIAAIIFAVAVCILFGLYPARKASKLDPVKALRYE